MCIYVLHIYLHVSLCKVGNSKMNKINNTLYVISEFCLEYKFLPTLVMLEKLLTLFESRYTLKGRYNIGYVGKTASMSMLTLFESRYTLKGRYNIGYVGNIVPLMWQLFVNVCIVIVFSLK